MTTEIEKDVNNVQTIDFVHVIIFEHFCYKIWLLVLLHSSGFRGLTKSHYYNSWKNLNFLGGSTVLNAPDSLNLLYHNTCISFGNL
jgi:hypothetical protein